MGMDPNTLLIAQIRPCKVSLDEFLEANVSEDYELTINNKVYSVVSVNSDTVGIYPDDGYFVVYTYLTYGWGEAVYIGEALEKIRDFRDMIQSYCENKDCTYKIQLSANFW